MVKLITFMGDDHLMHDLAVCFGFRVHINHGNAVRLRAVGAEHDGEGVVLGGCGHGKLRCRMERWIWA